MDILLWSLDLIIISKQYQVKEYKIEFFFSDRSPMREYFVSVCDFILILAPLELNRGFGSRALLRAYESVREQTRIIS